MAVQELDPKGWRASPRRSVRLAWLAVGGIVVLALGVVAWLLWGRTEALVVLPTTIPTPIVALGTLLPVGLAVMNPANGGELVQLARLGHGGLRALYYSADNRLLVAGTTAGAIVYDLSSAAGGQDLREARFIDTPAEATGVAVAVDGSVAVAMRDVVGLRLWRSGAADPVMLAETGTFSHLVFSPDGTLLAAAAGDRVSVWRVAGAEQVTLDNGDWAIGEVQQVAFSPDSAILAARGDPDTLLLWRASDLNLITRHDGAAFSFSADGKLIAAIDDRAVALWDPTSEERAEPLAKFYPEGGAECSGARP